MNAYEIRVHGHLDDHWADWFCVQSLQRCADGTTTMITGVVDQAQLHGVLSGLGDLGLELLVMIRIELPPEGGSPVPR